MHIAFTKMHGLGNDFLVFESRPGAGLPEVRQWRQLADRRQGVGFDQALLLEPPRTPDTTSYYRIFNADGTEVEQCGNGARCVARYLQLAGRVAADGRVSMGSPAGVVQAKVLADGQVAVDLGEPNFAPAALPFTASAAESTYSLQLGGEHVEFGAVSIGNPHVVLRVTDIESAPVERLGRALQADARFPQAVNVGFMQVLDARHIRLRVYERGVGETLACGTGACAAVAVGRNLGLLASEVEVHVPGGRLGVHWQGPGHSVWLTGPAAVSYTGQVDI
ncbi:MAG: diaminopimelate epimerase [Steroidobacteraceae bacterium]